MTPPVRVLPAAPRVGPLLAAAAVSGLRRRRPAALPAAELALPGVTADPAALARYARVCGFALRDELPVTYPHVLAFPLALALLTGRDFPFPLPGLVHVANTVVQRRPLRVGEEIELRVHAADLRPHERGRQVDVVTRALVGGAEVWTEISTYLRREGAAARGPAARVADEPDRPPAAARWRVPAGTGAAYAAVSGDRNPIHTSRLAARAFGFPRRIAHGMWSAARCLAALEPRLPPACRVTVAFKLPVPLPSTVELRTGGAGGTVEFDLRAAGSGRPHLLGTAGPA